jgi:hypothetical protein
MASYVEGFQEKNCEDLKLWRYPPNSLRPLSAASVRGSYIILDTFSQTPSVHGLSTVFGGF